MTLISAQSYSALFDTHLVAINTFLADHLPEQEPLTLWQAMRHGVLDGGKRIRPVLLLEVAQSLGAPSEQVLPTACALELIHCYSLIHDDLPCIDNDDLRRGKPTVHKVYGEAMAVLAGDALLAKSFGWIAGLSDGVKPSTIIEIIEKLSAISSTDGLVNGQVEDIQYAKHPPDKDILHRIHDGKTAALFKFCCWAGGMLAEQPEPVLTLLTQYGASLGMAFQITDDLLDVQAAGHILGKTPGKDAEQGKMTFPAVYGIEGAEAMLKQEVLNLYALLDRLHPVMNTDKLRFIVDFVAGRES